MHACRCGETFPGSLLGAWQAKLHAEDTGHRLRPARPPGGMDMSMEPPVR